MLVLIALGSGVGLVHALTGAGGSIIAVPVLMVAMGWTVTKAGPVALLAVASKEWRTPAPVTPGTPGPPPSRAGTWCASAA